MLQQQATRLRGRYMVGAASKHHFMKVTVNAPTAEVFTATGHIGSENNVKRGAH